LNDPKIQSSTYFRRNKTVLKSTRLLVFVLAIIAFTSNTGVFAADPLLSKLIVNKNELVMEIGDTSSLTATAVFTDATSKNVTIYAEWSSDNAAVATVYNGTISAKGEGTTTIVAIYGGLPQSIKVTVTKKVKALTKDVQNIDLRKGESSDIELTAIYSDNSTDGVSDKAEWSTSDSSIATVINGTVTGHSPGSATITAKYGTVSLTVPVSVEIVKRLDPGVKQLSLLLNDVPVTVELIATYPDGTKDDVAAGAQWSSSDDTIVDAINGEITAYGAGTATLTAKYGTKTATIKVDVDTTRKLTVDEDNVFLKVGDSKKITLTATYPNGTTSDVTSNATWKSSDESVASVFNGFIDANRSGAVTITGTYGNKTVEITVDVETARYLDIQNTSLTMRVASQEPLELIATHVDGSTLNVTQKAKWTSSDEKIAYVSNGVVHARAMGDARITGSYGGKTITITVDVDIPRKLTADPKTISIDPDEVKQISLIATYANGLEEWVTDKAEWTTASEDIAEVEKGLVKAIAIGTTTITAKYGNRAVTIKTEIGQVNEMTADVTKVVLGVNETKQVTLTAKQADGAIVNVTSLAEWKSSVTDVASVSSGNVKAHASGKSTLTATYGGKSVTIPVEVDIVQKLEASLRILSLKSGEKRQVVLTATFSDGSKRDVARDAEWKSSNYKVADVTGGLISGLAYGKATISAKYGTMGITIQTDVDTLKYLQTDVVIVTMKVGQTKQIKAIASYKDGTEIDVTRDALWTTSKALSADVKDGLIRAHSKGKVTITASYGGIKTKVVVTIQ
jgi:uncharacterized protein YjdB